MEASDDDLVARLIAENTRLRKNVEALTEQLATVERLADSDTLTPLPNRRAFTRELARVVRGVARYGTPAAVMFVDVDALKSINDTRGHFAGDAAIIHIARVLSDAVRATDIVARIGGDEFGLLLDHLDEAAAAAKADNLLAAVEANPLHLDGQAVPLRLSIGLAMIRSDDSTDAIMARADASMYAAKFAQRSLR
jgi:diguanylate cyclase (GGDEF)-like protein